MLETLKTDLIDSTLSSRKAFVRALFERPDSFAKILPYEEYLDDAGVFVLKDGSLGAVFELSLIEHEPLSAEKIIETVEGLKSWFFLPEHCTLQLLFDQAHIPARDPVWRQTDFKSPNPVSKALYEAR